MGLPPLFIACQMGHLPVAFLILKKHPSTAQLTTTKNHVTPLYVASQNGHASIVSLIIQKDPSTIRIPKNNGCTPLHIAVENGHISIVSLLVEADPSTIRQTNKQGHTPFYYACQDGQLSALSLFIKKDPDSARIVADGGWSPLHAACHYGQSSIVSAHALVALDSNLIRVRSADGITPLDCACRQGHSEIVRVLLTADRSLATPDLEARTRNVWQKHEVADLILQLIRLNERFFEEERPVPSGERLYSIQYVSLSLSSFVLLTVRVSCSFLLATWAHRDWVGGPCCCRSAHI